ncbi:Clavaminate synthase-like protein, partial [Hortaea werneckii]
MEIEEVKVAITPFGNADAVVSLEDGRLVFVEPYERNEEFPDFLTYVQKSSSKGKEDTANVKYAQTQNDNLRNEYSNLYGDVPKDIPWARIALQQNADAVNLWVGNDRSVTSLHKDNYENLYVQIRGQKHFVLLPPVEMPCVNETPLARGRYVPGSSSGAGEEERLEVKVEEGEGEDAVPVAIWDPDLPSEKATPYSHLAEPLRVTLNEGDMLYLPALWYHKVSQTAGEEGFVCAVNYWYDMDFSGPFWSQNNFIREVYNKARKQPDYP